MGKPRPVPTPSPAAEEELARGACEANCVHYLGQLENYADYIDSLRGD